MHNNNEYDLIVVGSGAGAMTAAITAADQGLSVLMVEKAAQYGGTSALSGGGIWIPNNHYFKAIGGKDSEELAWTYLKAAVGDRVDERRLRTYLHKSPEMIAWLEDNTRVRYAVAEKYPDYYQHLPGALPGGRSLDPELFDLSQLGDELGNLREGAPGNMLMGRIAWTARDAHKAMSKSRGWRLMVLWMMLRYKLDFRWRRKTGSRRDRRTALGNALIASLRASMMDRNIPLWLSTNFTDLVIEDGRVCGIQVERAGRVEVLRARRGVILGSGGFEQNQALRDKYLPQPTKAAWSATPAGANTGAALEAAQRIGAATDLMEWGWWAPSLLVPGEDRARGIFAERAFPGAIVVNSLGQRFVNEAAPYLEFVDAMYRNNEQTGGKCVPAWAIFDSHFRFNYAMGPLMPAQIMPDIRLRKEWLNNLYYKADTLDALAGQIGVDAAGLKETVSKMNGYAATGEDLDFARGGNVFDRYYGDSNVSPNPCLAPIGKGPFYAMPMYSGDIGTKGGLLTNEHAQVVREDGSTIDGLYAIGNTSASVLGTTYPGAGGTLGPAMTFGYVAALHLAGAVQLREKAA
ncbi:FAD-binding protein [Halopseudomonas aestusnigri]|uniref:3-oxosteroid 1-dehydrogenase n=1 Tax=Halopseudomonas aestusnigri TaxID=857252 RepID=A0AAQ1G729_9GAMM|nr:FAD-binding protein [Halopseudomonas aestusnigri]OWL89232.1 3-oxosteroid 1-dehydrogenase [Halopseudomonas aestusnigri]SEG06364.1 3-oxosteroid 1-dehydrogenase [Halopseudomonas aestusnigri]